MVVGEGGCEAYATIARGVTLDLEISDIAEESADERNTLSAQNWEDVSRSLDHLRKTAKQRKSVKFTTLVHPINVDALRDA